MVAKYMLHSDPLTIRCICNGKAYIVLSSHSKRRPKLVFKTEFCLMQVKSIAEWEHSAILSTFIKLPFVIKVFLLSIFEWPLKTGFTVYLSIVIERHWMH